jgi:hypothetical protein
MFSGAGWSSPFSCDGRVQVADVMPSANFLFILNSIPHKI